METLKEHVRQAMTPPSKEDQRKLIMRALKIISAIALVIVLMIGIGWTSYLSGLSQGRRNAEAAARVTNYHKWEVPIIAPPADESKSTPAASARPTDNFPPPIVGNAPSHVVGSVKKLLTLSQAPTVTVTFGTDSTTVLVTLDAVQWHELLALSGDAILQKVGLGCIDPKEVCYEPAPGMGKFNQGPSAVGLSVATVQHLAEPYVDQLTAQQATHIIWRVTVEQVTP